MIQVRFFFWKVTSKILGHPRTQQTSPCCFLSRPIHLLQPWSTRPTDSYTHSTVGGHVYNKLSSRSYRDGQSTCPKHFYRAETTNTSFGEQLEFSNVIRLKVIQHGEQEIWDILSLGAMAPTVDCGAQIQKSAALTTVHICCTWNNSWTSLLLLQYTLSMKPDVEP